MTDLNLQILAASKFSTIIYDSNVRNQVRPHYGNSTWELLQIIIVSCCFNHIVQVLYYYNNAMHADELVHISFATRNTKPVKIPNSLSGTTVYVNICSIQQYHRTLKSQAILVRHRLF